MCWKGRKGVSTCYRSVLSYISYNMYPHASRTGMGERQTSAASVRWRSAFVLGGGFGWVGEWWWVGGGQRGACLHSTAIRHNMPGMASTASFNPSLANGRTAVEGEGAVVGEHEVEVVAAAGGGPVVGEGAAIVVLCWG